MQFSRDARAVTWFVVLSFAGTWLLWSVLWLPGTGDRRLLMVLLGGIGMWGPGLAALLSLRFLLGESWRTTTADRLGRKRYYAWAWLLPAVLTVLSGALTVAFGLARFDLEASQLGQTLEASGAPMPVPMWVLVAAQVVLALTVAPLLNMLFALGEELGWRGFLLPRLIRAGLGQWQALVISGIIWGLWHAPIVALGYNYPDHADDPLLCVGLMTVFCTLLGIIFGWLRLASGSVWVPTLAHGALNAVAGLPFVVLSPFDSAMGGALTSVTGWIPMCLFIAWLFWSGRLPVRRECFLSG